VSVTLVDRGNGHMTAQVGVLTTFKQKLLRIVVSCDPEFYRGNQFVMGNVEFCMSASPNGLHVALLLSFSFHPISLHLD